MRAAEYRTNAFKRRYLDARTVPAASSLDNSWRRPVPRRAPWHAVADCVFGLDTFCQAGSSGGGGRFPAICGMPVSPTIGSDAHTATGSELDRHHPESFMNYW